MNCAEARFLLYAYLEREISSFEAESLARHLPVCAPCSLRARSARDLGRVLRSRSGRTPAPSRLRERIRLGENASVRFRYPLLATAAVVLFLLVPLVADVSPPRFSPASFGASPGQSAAPRLLAASFSTRGGAPPEAPALVARRMSGTLVCLDCESRAEVGLCPLPSSRHEPAFCADNGEVWRLMSRDPGYAQTASGQTLTLEGVGFIRSGYLRASRVGY